MSNYNTLKYNQKTTMETCEINNRSLDMALSLTNLEPFLRSGQDLKKYLKIIPILIYSKQSSISDLRIENLFFKNGLNNFTPNLNPNFLKQEELLPGMNYNLEEYKFIYFPSLNINKLGRSESFVDPLTNQLNQKIEIKNKKVKELHEQYPKMTEYYIDMLYDWLWGRSDEELEKMMDHHKSLPESERLVKKEPIGHLDPIKVIKGGYDPDEELNKCWNP